MNVSILILTLNEEQNLPDCLASVAWSDDVVVLDSLSSDRTVDIAAAAGARTIQRKFDNWAAHQNWAMGNIDFKHRWVFYLDADERVTDELRDELCTIAGDAAEVRVAFYCPRKNIFMGRWIRNAMPPGAIMRFFQPNRVCFERLVNPTPVIDGPHGYLRNHLLHFNFSKGLTEWLEKHNRYSLYEAIEGVKELKGNPVQLRVLFSGDAFARRQALKQLSFRLPFRPLLKFLYLYVLRRGFLDGRPGLTYCLLQSVYEYMIVIKMDEIHRREKGLPI